MDGRSLPEIVLLVAVAVVFVSASLGLLRAEALARAWARMQYRRVVETRRGREVLRGGWRSPGDPRADDAYIASLAALAADPSQVPGGLVYLRAVLVSVATVSGVMLVLILTRCPCRIVTPRG